METVTGLWEEEGEEGEGEEEGEGGELVDVMTERRETEDEVTTGDAAVLRAFDFLGEQRRVSG